MAQFDCYEAAGGLLVDIQADLLDRLTTRAVAPLLPVEAVPPPIRNLHPQFELGGRRYVLAMHLLTAVPAQELRVRRATFATRRHEIVRALDMLLSGG